MEEPSAPVTETAIPTPGNDKPSDLYLKKADEIYEHLKIPEDKRAEIIRCAKEVYEGSGFANIAFSRLPKKVVRPAVKQLQGDFETIYPPCKEFWFARWALWWQHTEPVAETKTTLSAQNMKDMWATMRVNDEERKKILKRVRTVYKNANLPNKPYKDIDIDTINVVVEEISSAVRTLYPDARRAPEFPRFILWRWHKNPTRRPENKTDSDEDEDEGDEEDENEDWD